MRRLLSTASLFASTGTLLCCALPATLVALGAGSVFASLISQVPQLVWLSEYKGITFGLAGFLLSSSAILQWRARGVECPADPRLAEACRTNRTWMGPVFWVALSLFLIGAFFAFAPTFFKWA
jgi:hypothetical protein